MTDATKPETDQLRDLHEEAFATVAQAVADGEQMDSARLAALLLAVGRVNGPALLFDAWFGSVIEAGTLAGQIGRVWSMAEYPDAALPRSSWRQMFTAAGYTADGRPAPRPTSPVELWRGSVPDRRADWSWTALRTVAEGYATGTGARRPTTGRLYRTLAPASALLAYNRNRDEDEYVIDTRGLEITEVPVSPATA